jgi:acetoacetate decarboxylase
MCLGKNRRGDGRSYRYWYLKAKANSARRKPRVCELAERYREDGHLRGVWGYNVKLRGDPPALSAERPSRMDGSTP